MIFWILPAMALAAQQPENRLMMVGGKERLDVLVELVNYYNEVEPKKVLTFGQQALDMLEFFPAWEQEVEVLNHLSFACTQLGEFEQALEYGQKSLTLARQTGDKKGEARAVANLGLMYWHQGDYSNARVYFLDSLKLNQCIPYKKGMADSSYLMGMYYWKLSDFAQGLDYVLKANRLYEELEDNKGLANTHNMIGAIYSGTNEYRDAQEHFSNAYKYFKNLGDLQGMGKTLSNMGLMRIYLGNYAGALENLREAHDISRQLGIKMYIANSLNNIGEVYAAMKKYLQALDHFNQALEIKESIGDKRGMAYTLINIGRIHRYMGDYAGALKNLERAAAIASEIETKSEIEKAYLELSRTHEGKGQYRQALNYFKRYKEMKDIIFSQQNADKLAFLRTRYELEKKEKETGLLKKDREIKRLSLKQQRNVKNTLIGMIILVLILAVAIYTRYRLKAKLTRTLTREMEEHRQTSEKLRESEETFRALAEKSVVGIYITQDNVIQYVNPRFLEIFGYNAEEMVGKSPLTLVYEEDLPGVEEKLSYQLNSKPLVCEFRGLTKDGDVIHLESYGTQTQYQGKPAILATIIDVTGRKRTEIELVKSQKFESIGILAGGIAHDFNNLLAVIIGNLSLVIEDFEGNERIIKNLKAAEKASLQASDLSRKLVTLSRGGVGKVQQIKFLDILKSTLAFYPEYKSVIGTVSIPFDLNPLGADERLLRQVLHNLLQNAREATYDSSLIAVRAENVYLDIDNNYGLIEGDYVKVSIVDRGRGIPAGQLQKVFEPYFSTKGTVTKKGMGLGLAICHSIVKKHKGHITIQSEIGKGTTVDVYLPVGPENL